MAHDEILPKPLAGPPRASGHSVKSSPGLGIALGVLMALVVVIMMFLHGSLT